MRNLILALLSVIILAGCSKQQQDTTQNIVVATFNMRYDNPDDSMNNWQYRKERVAQFIIDQNIDIVGTQELLQNQVDDLKALLPDFDMVGVARDNGKDEGEYAAIFFRRDRFEVLDSNNFWLCENPDSVGMKGWDAACTRIATWAKLKDKTNDKIFMAVNTHFDHVGEVARRESALLIISKIKEIVGDHLHSSPATSMLTTPATPTPPSPATNLCSTTRAAWPTLWKVLTTLGTTSARNLPTNARASTSFSPLRASRCSRCLSRKKIPRPS